jgi:hypothetical protein
MRIVNWNCNMALQDNTNICWLFAALPEALFVEAAETPRTSSVEE